MNDVIKIINAKTNNLKGISCSIPKGTLCCVTGLSGSGKSSFAFDTLYIEGQRRYVQTLTSHAKRIIANLPKPEIDAISGLTPTISLSQKTTAGSPRSTVGTLTEIYDYLRLLYARRAIAFCPMSHEPVQSQSREQIVNEISSQWCGQSVTLLSPHLRHKKGTLKDELSSLERKGFSRIRLNGSICRIQECTDLDPAIAHDLDVIVDRLIIRADNHERLKESAETALEMSKGLLIIYTEEDEKLFSEYAYSTASGISYPPLEPQDFSFNTLRGMCSECQGLGVSHTFILDKVIDPEKSIKDDFCLIAGSYSTIFYQNVYDNLAHLFGFSVDTPWKNLSEQARRVLLHGTEKKWTRMTFINPNTGSTWSNTISWRGIIHEAKTKYHDAKTTRNKQRYEQFMRIGRCSSCKGSRIKPYPAAAKLFSKTIGEILEEPIEQVHEFFTSALKSNPSDEIIRHIVSKLQFLHDVGLGYLTLNRGATTLSGGEFQRVRLASHIGSALVDITYILDEPSIGLHPRDNQKLLSALFHLKEKGNTVVVVEHDIPIMRASDYILDFGPGAGEEGGKLLYEGPLETFKNTPSLTSDYLFGRKIIARPTQKRTLGKKRLVLKGVSHNNLQEITLSIPVNTFTAITGVSGSGKSSLILDTLYPALSNILMGSDIETGAYEDLRGATHFNKVLHIDQSPIGKTPRSTPATYTGVFNEIRSLFASLPESKSLGWTPGRFSSNVEDGSCSTCSGLGSTCIDMDFLEEAWVTCETCKGKRFDPETLSVHYKGKSIGDILSMTCSQAFDFFDSIPKIRRKLKTLCQIGLGYLQLGQSSTTLSGGESQRLKIARELSRPNPGKTIYLLDEPTTGLHAHNLAQLLEILHALVDEGNTVVVIEHNMDLVKTADYVIDLGPESGPSGGKIVGVGRPETISQLSTPTGKALQDVFSPRGYTPLPPPSIEKKSSIEIRGAHQNNLKNLSLSLPKEKLIAITGPSGSGKNSLGFQTLYAEGQRQYVESLSPYTRQFISQRPRPAVDLISGVSPSVGLEHTLHISNRRSTLGTITEAYDYLRILWANLGTAYCPKTGYQIRQITPEYITDVILQLPPKTRVQILALVETTTSLPHQISQLRHKGYHKIYLNGIILDEEAPPFALKGKKHTLEVVIDRLCPNGQERKRILGSLEQALRLTQDKVTLLIGEQKKSFNLAFSVPETGDSFPNITAQTFSFNSTHGQCSACHGLGSRHTIDPLILKTPPAMSTIDLIEQLLGTRPHKALRAIDIHPKTPIGHLTPSQQSALFFGTKEWKGLQDAIDEDEIEDLPNFFQDALSESQCPSCMGTRLSPLARNVTLCGLSIADFCSMPIFESASWFKHHIKNRSYPKPIERIQHEIEQRFALCEKLGIGYLSLSRCARSLSSGEAQRARLVSQIGSDLSGLTYILNKPSAGLHPQDNESLVEVLKEIKALGNTVVLIEHDHQLIEACDHVIEMGTGSGKDGGKIVYEGKPQQEPKRALPYTDVNTKAPQLDLKNVSHHNINNLSCSIPLETIVGIVGLSGSGKSTLVFDILEPTIQAHLANTSSQYKVKGLEAIRRLVTIDTRETPRTVRSDVCSFLGISKPIRDFFSSIPEARARGLSPAHFSPYHHLGMCKTCRGLGYKRVDMYFLPTAHTTCDSCHGLRLNQTSLCVEYQGLNLGQLLSLPIKEISALFTNHPKISTLTRALLEVDLGYLTLGEEMASLSLSQLQRVRIAAELARKRKTPTLYLIDEPSKGLHQKEVDHLIEILKTFRNSGDSVILIDHNLDLIASCEYLIELGPGAGNNGGKVVGTGSPKMLMKTKNSPTGRFLRKSRG